MNMRFITPAQEIRCPRFVRSFEAEPCVKAELAVTGLGLYRAFINGQRVGDAYLTPGYNDYTAYLRVQTYDVTDLLAAENTLEIHIGNGWYRGRFGLQSRENIFGDKDMTAARLTMTHADGSVTVLETDDAWQAGPSPVIDGGIYDGETRDDTRDLSASVACEAIDPPCEPELDGTPAIRCTQTLTPTLIVSPKGEQILDFGQNMVGVVRFFNRQRKGSKLHLYFGETLQQDCFYRDNLRSAKAAFHYVSDGKKKEVEPQFTFYGFRYVLVEGPKTVRPEDFTGIVFHSALKETLRVETDHPGLNQLMRNALWGQRGNFVDVPTDCPQRDERLGWTADTQVFVNTACYQMDCKDFYRKFMRDMRVDQTKYYGGDIPAYSPSLRHEAIPGGAVWADAGTIVPWHVYAHYGDRELLKENYPMMYDYTELCINRDSVHGGSHIIDFGFTFGDWLAMDGVTEQAVHGGTDESYIRSVYYMNTLRLTAKAAETLGYSEDAARFGALADDTLAAIRREFFTPGGRLAVDTQTGYVLALYYGLYTDEQKTVAGFRERLRRDGYTLRSGFTGTPLMLEAMMDHGMTDEAYRMLYNEEFPGWLYCVKLGATTVWERWNSLLPDGTISGTGMNSLNHYAYGSVAEAVYTRIAGLRPAEPGWKRAIVAPQLNWRMKHITLSYDSPVGTYTVGWRIEEDGDLTVTVAVPDGGHARVILPDHPDHAACEVYEGTRTIRYTPAVDRLHPFSGQSLATDVMHHAEAAAVLKATCPELYDRLAADDGSLAFDTLYAVQHHFSDDATPGFDAADAALRRVRA